MQKYGYLGEKKEYHATYMSTDKLFLDKDIEYVNIIANGNALINRILIVQ